MQFLRFCQLNRLSSSSPAQAALFRQRPLSSIVHSHYFRSYNNNNYYYYYTTRVSSVRGFAHCSSAAMAGVSKACCSIPPVVTQGYKEKGEYKTIGGLKTYITGPEDATKAILIIYDIFGFFPQTLQGADILATADKDQQYRVFIPDFFKGEPADISWYPPTDDEKKQKLGKFFETKAAPPATLSKIPDVVADANKLSPSSSGFTAWGILGYCWGGKVANLQAGAEGAGGFKAAAQCHPAMVDPKDATKVTVPMALLASKDEDPDAVKGYQDNLKGAKLVETFPTQIHGWMAARSNLADPEVQKEYERGYRTVLGFFHEHL